MRDLESHGVYVLLASNPTPAITSVAYDARIIGIYSRKAGSCKHPLYVSRVPILVSTEYLASYFRMSAFSAASVKWEFTRPDPPETTCQYFRTDLRLIAGQQTDNNLPWQDDMYLAYPSLENPSWPAFVAEAKRLNEEADADTYHKIVYIIRRAHSQ